MSETKKRYGTLSLTGKVKLDDIDKKAKELEMNRAKAVSIALEWFFEMDNEIIKRILKYSEGLDIPHHTILENILIMYFVERECPPRRKQIPEFSKIFNENNAPVPVTGEKLWHLLRAHKAKLSNMTEGDEEKESKSFFPDDYVEENITEKERVKWKAN